MLETRTAGGVLQPPVPPPRQPRRRQRSPLLRVVGRIDARSVAWEPRAGLPAGGRAECRRGERPCPYVRCWWHLWRIDAADRAGRRPRAGEAVAAPGTTILPAWLEYPTPACCGADYAEAAARGQLVRWREIADAMHLSRTSIYAMRRSIMGKLRAEAKELAPR